ncbi:GAF domain-containing protein [Phytophthora infestans T30-4]|uniref:GAF domain-containing protein n=1 Tax=Phytophthora infestans (strain T30-4) TaxID=403677 RepID=D0NRA8_PHYIT|nr:GAF domain-containing protein [Phytophthora infestans T30-4]EEY63230.1 GAF domain-containing protein [Phytophthora infestans T30-4]|eukprot:XP_002898407.1 GAF domain-containing protein [Phytophthora infestans T30-4]
MEVLGSGWVKVHLNNANGFDGAPFKLSASEKASTRLKCDDEELLMAQTEAEAAPGVDFDSLSSISLDEWETGIGRHKHSKDENLRALSRQRNPDTTEVLVMGELQCSVVEAAALLCCFEEADFNANMKRIHGHSFECGSVVRSFSSSKSDNQDEELTPYRLLKTSSFKHSRLAVLDYDERWCFLEDFEPVTQERFTLSQRSVRPDALPPECVGCARKFHKLLPIKKTRCYLCAQFVCWRCWARQPLDTINGRKISVLVCPHCLDTIRNCNHARLVFSSRGSGSSASTSSHGSGGEIYRSTRIQPDVDDALEPGQAVVSYLADILSDDSEASQSDASMDSNKARKTHTAAKVLQELTSVLDEGINRVMAHCFWDSDNSGALISDLTPSMPAALLKLQSQLSRELLPVEACSLSQAVTPIYPLGSSPRTPRGPIPPNEAHRLEAITQDQLLTARGSDELGLICELATQELSCLASLVTIVGKSLLHVLASSSPAFQNAEVPREQTLCQYLLMGDRPMLLQHPENDVRFCKIPLLIDNNIQFYAGFPIFSRDGLSVVGSLCCLDVRPQEMTQSQYSTLLHLTRTASSIINKKCTKPPGLSTFRCRNYRRRIRTKR